MVTDLSLVVVVVGVAVPGCVPPPVNVSIDDTLMSSAQEREALALVSTEYNILTSIAR